MLCRLPAGAQIYNLLNLDRLNDVDFKRYLRLILTVIGAVYLVQAIRLYLG